MGVEGVRELFHSVSQPVANKDNMKEFCAAWMWNNGGTERNAWRVWQVECRENENRG